MSESLEAYIDGKFYFESEIVSGNEAQALKDLATEATAYWFPHWEEHGGFGEVDKIIHIKDDEEAEADSETVKELNEMTRVGLIEMSQEGS